MGIEQPFRAGDPLSAAKFEEMRKLLIQVLKVGGCLQISNTAAGIFITCPFQEQGCRIAKVYSDALPARDGLELGKGQATIYKADKDASKVATIEAGEIIDVYNYLSTEILVNKYIIVSYSPGIGWLAISEDCDQIDIEA